MHIRQGPELAKALKLVQALNAENELFKFGFLPFAFPLLEAGPGLEPTNLR
jgi:hypothetical protein